MVTPEDKPTKRKPRKPKTDGAGQPTRSRLTARQLAMNRLVSSYGYECNKVFQQLYERQERWKSELEAGGAPLGGDNMEEDQHTGEGLPSPAERKRVAWRQTEREALKKCFLSFGFGRWKEIECAMHNILKSVRHGRGDMEDACWEFVSELLPHVEGKEEEYLKMQIEQVKDRMPITTPGVGWTKIQSSAKIWARRLQLLDNITSIAHQLANDSGRRQCEHALKTMSDTNPPAPWWSLETDMALIQGVHKHGYGNYFDVRTDKQFADAFRGAYSEEGMDDGTNRAEGHGGAASIPDETPETWPATDILTKRLKRVTEHLMKGSTGNQQKGRLPIWPRQSGEASLSRTWSRKEKIEMMKTLMSFGMPMSDLEQGSKPEKFTVDWKTLGEHSGQGDRPEGMIKQLVQELSLEVQELTEEGATPLSKTSHSENCQCAVCNVKQKSKTKRPREEDPSGFDDHADHAGEEGDVDEYDANGETNELQTKVKRQRRSPAMLRVLTHQTATRLKERLDMLSTLREGLELIKDLNSNRSLSTRVQEMPPWWVPGMHDYELVCGILKHGMGAWVAIERDPVLSFYACAHVFELTDKKIPSVCDSNPVEEAHRIASSCGVGALEIPPEGGDGILPDSKVLLKRLKQITTLLRKVLKKNLNAGFSEQSGSVNPKRTPLARTSSGGGGHAGKPKKLKYTRNRKVGRYPDGKPILPLSLTTMLTLVDLGRVEWQRIAFHSERHIYPIGYKACRSYNSTVDPERSTTYTCEIIDGKSRPIFKITAEDDPDLEIKNDTPSGAWVEIFCHVNEARGIKKDKVTISGTDMFGLSHPVISRLIQELPNAEKCAYFIPELSFYPPECADHEPAGTQATNKTSAKTFTPAEHDNVPEEVQEGGEKVVEDVNRCRYSNEHTRMPLPGPANVSATPNPVVSLTVSDADPIECTRFPASPHLELSGPCPGGQSDLGVRSSSLTGVPVQLTPLAAQTRLVPGPYQVVCKPGDWQSDPAKHSSSTLPPMLARLTPLGHSGMSRNASVGYDDVPEDVPMASQKSNPGPATHANQAVHLLDVLPRGALQTAGRLGGAQVQGPRGLPLHLYPDLQGRMAVLNTDTALSHEVIKQNAEPRILTNLYGQQISLQDPSTYSSGTLQRIQFLGGQHLSGMDVGNQQTLRISGLDRVGDSSAWLYHTSPMSGNSVQKDPRSHGMGGLGHRRHMSDGADM